MAPVESLEEFGNRWRTRALEAESRLNAVIVVIEHSHEYPHMGLMEALENAAGIEDE